MKHRSKGRSQAPISRPSGGPVFVSPEDQKRMSLDSTTRISSPPVRPIRSPLRRQQGQNRLRKALHHTCSRRVLTSVLVLGTTKGQHRAGDCNRLAVSADGSIFMLPGVSPSLPAPCHHPVLTPSLQSSGSVVGSLFFCDRPVSISHGRPGRFGRPQASAVHVWRSGWRSAPQLRAWNRPIKKTVRTNDLRHDAP